jgi:hypothetical protein
MVVAALAALGLAGCGGGDSNKTLSYSDFGKKADEVCASEGAKIKLSSAKLTGNPKTDAPIYDELIPKLKAARDKFKALKPPDALKADFDRFNSLTDQQIAGAEAAQAAAKTGDRAAYIQAVRAIGPLNQQSNLAASKLGSAVCAK